MWSYLSKEQPRMWTHQNRRLDLSTVVSSIYPLTISCAFVVWPPTYVTPTAGWIFGTDPHQLVPGPLTIHTALLPLSPLDDLVHGFSGSTLILVSNLTHFSKLAKEGRFWLEGTRCLPSDIRYSFLELILFRGRAEPLKNLDYISS